MFWILFQVCLRNNPLYHAGAVAFSVSAGIPKVGVLLESVWNMNDSCRFQLRSPESLKNMEKTTKTQEIKLVSFPQGKEAFWCLVTLVSMMIKCFSVS